MANLAPSWRPKSLPNRGRNPKKSMLENNTFFASILDGFGPRFGRVFNRFFGAKGMPKAIWGKVWKANKTLRGRTFFWCWLLQQASKFEQKSMKNHMFFGTSILKAFWKDCGQVLEGQNHWFFAFLEEKSEANFKVLFERPKNRKKNSKNKKDCNFWPARRNVRGPGER